MKVRLEPEEDTSPDIAADICTDKGLTRSHNPIF